MRYCTLLDRITVVLRGPEDNWSFLLFSMTAMYYAIKSSMTRSTTPLYTKWLREVGRLVAMVSSAMKSHARSGSDIVASYCILERRTHTQPELVRLHSVILSLSIQVRYKYAAQSSASSHHRGTS